MPTSSVIPSDYPALRRKVEETLLLGQSRIEQAKVQTYWQTGKLINEHILRHESRSEHYGQEVVEKLSEDLTISVSTLWRCVQFARSFKILAARRESLSPLTWAHYRELITIPDEETRLSFTRRAEKSSWTSRELARKIYEEVKESAPEGNGKPSSSAIPKLIPRKGTIYTYRLIAPDSVHKQEDERLWIDLGFQVHRQIPSTARNFKEGQIIESLKKDGDYGISATDRQEEALFTYQAHVERVVDGDTLLVKIDLGFETRIRQYLRLRGIDAPELTTPEGKKSKSFVERELAKAPRILLTSSRSDKYDRYLADVFYRPPNGVREDKRNALRAPKELAGVSAGEGERYLNQVLIDEGLAERWG
ncbi:MAG: DUF1016 N-terminal domain-containing protein [Candidatus Omnitrophota bacterium]|nr:DUF1016 N-terminal domain-containing protein [Candidatus Omnitrophota bacterium]